MNDLPSIVMKYDALLTRYVQIFTHNKYLAPVLVKEAFEHYYSQHGNDAPTNLKKVLKAFCVYACTSI